MTKRAAKRPLVTARLPPDRIFVVKRKGKMGTTEKTEIRKQAIRRVLTRWINNRKAETGNETAPQTETAANTVTGKPDYMEKPVLTDNEKSAADHSENGMTSPAPDLPATTGREPRRQPQPCHHGMPDLTGKIPVQPIRRHRVGWIRTSGSLPDSHQKNRMTSRPSGINQNNQ